jgi:hypothetical protein
VLAVARHEVRDRWLVFGVAVTAWVALLAAARWVPGLTRSGNLMAVLGAMLAFALPVAIALSLGASILARDAAERRLAFYLARPMSPLALWAGKLLAAASVLGFLVACGVVGLAAYEHRALRVHPISVAAALVSCFVLAATHLAATALRSRSPWLVVDVAAGVAWVAGALALARWAFDAGLGGPFIWEVLPAAFVGFALAVAVGAYAQIAVGRTDPARGHRALSLTAWPLLGVLLAIAWGFGSWHLGQGPDRLGVGRMTVAAPAGPGVIAGSERWDDHDGYAPVFLLNTQTGRWTPFADYRFSRPALNAPGTRAAWIAGTDEGASGVFGFEQLLPRTVPALVLARFEGPAPVVGEVPLPHGPWGVVRALDADARRAAIESGSDLVVVDTADGRALGVLRRTTLHAVFRDDGRLRVWTAEGRLATSEITAVDWAVDTGVQTEKARFPPLPSAPYFRPLEGGGDVGLRLGYGGRRDAVVDAATGSTLALPARAAGVRLLADGRLAFGVDDELRIVDRAGDLQRAVRVPGTILAITEPVPGQLAVGIFDPRHAPSSRTVIVVVATGAIVREHPGLLPLQGSVGPPPPAGSPGSRLGQRNGGLFGLEPDGSLREIVPEQE